MSEVDWETFELNRMLGRHGQAWTMYEERMKGSTVAERDTYFSKSQELRDLAKAAVILRSETDMAFLIKDALTAILIDTSVTPEKVAYARALAQEIAETYPMAMDVQLEIQNNAIDIKCTYNPNRKTRYPVCK